jgi:DNA-binding HxlR family transcriptional regulator
MVIGGDATDMRRKNLDGAICPIARTLDVVGDWWTLLIVRDAFHGLSRFVDFQKNLGLAKNILSARLRTLVANGILEKRPSADGGARDEYGLTEKGRRLRVVLLALRQWGEDNLFAEGEPMMVASDRDNRPLARLRLMNEEGRALEPEEIVATRGRKPGARATSMKARPTRAR